MKRFRFRAFVLAALAFAALSVHAHTPVTRSTGNVADDCPPSPMDAPGTGFYQLWDDADCREPFTLGPLREGVTTRFGTASEREFRSGRTRITIQLDELAYRIKYLCVGTGIY